MISLINVSKKFKKQYALKNINLKFPDKGLFAICGPSGCGKTTLLNAIASLIDYKGEIIIDDINCNKISANKKAEIRNKKIGFVFQDYKLFEYESVESNLMLTLNMKSNDTQLFKKRRIKDLLSIVDLNNKEKTLVKNLSGGEKQRLAIARALSAIPKIILADEPTGNLDSVNSIKIMELFQKISMSSLVILISHDEELVKKYANTIIKMEDGSIKNIEKINKDNNKSRLSLIKITNLTKKARISSKFLFNHATNMIKMRKWRTLFVLFTSSLGLIGVGLGTLITNLISENLYKSYSSFLDENKVVLTAKNSDESRETITSISYDEIYDVYNDNKEDVSYVGIYYQNDFNIFFDNYSFSLDFEGNNKVLPSFSIANFNEYMHLKDCKNVIHKVGDAPIENDEIILGLTAGLLNEICFQLKISRSVSSFKNYLNNNKLKMIISVANNQWDYFKDFVLTIKGFAMMDFDCFIHDSDTWNEYIFEEKFEFPITNKINVNTSHPWDLKKVYYLNFAKNRDLFIEKVKFTSAYKYLIAEILSDDYMPLLYKKSSIEECNKIALYNMEKIDNIPKNNISYFKEASKHIKNVVPTSNETYAVYPNNLMMGFARQTFISSDSNYLENIIDLTSYINNSDDKIMNTPDNVILGYFAKANSMSFNADYKLLKGNYPGNYNEIVISSGLAKLLNFKSPINKSIYICFPKEERLLSNGFIKRNYKMTDIKIVGVSESNKIELNHNEKWPILFFQTKLNISSFQLGIDSVIFDVDNGSSEEVVTSLNKSFPSFVSVCPISGIKNSVLTTCSSIENILVILSISSVIISSILLTICNYLYFGESKKDIGLILCLGATKKESKKFIYVHSLLMSTLSLIFSIIDLFLICFVLSNTLAGVLGIEASFVFNPFSILYMIIVCYAITLISSFIIAQKINRYNPFECLSD